MLLEALRSIHAQTLTPLEVIVAFDGADASAREAVTSQFPDVLIVNCPSLGRSIAANMAVAQAHGDFVCFLDDDDLWHPRKLELTYLHLQEHPGCLAVRNPVWFFRDSPDAPTNLYGFEAEFIAATLEEACAAAANASPKNSFDYLDIAGNSYRLMLERNRGVFSATVVERSTFIAAGGMPPGLTMADDWTFFLNVSRITEWQLIRERLGFTRIHSSQASRRLDNGVKIAAAKVAVWYGGRADPHRDGLPTTAMFRPYLQSYSRELEQFMREAVKEHDLGIVRLLLPFTALLRTPEAAARVVVGLSSRLCQHVYRAVRVGKWS